MATIDELVVRISADSSKLKSELAKMNATVSQSSSKMSDSFTGVALTLSRIVPAVAVTALTGLAKSGLDAAGRFTDLSQRIDFTASSLSALEPLLVQSGGSLDSFAASINILNSNVGSAISGNDSLNSMFQRLGLSARELQAMGPEKAFYAIADALAKVETQSEQTEIGRAILGRGFAQMIPILKEANGNLEALVETQKEMGNGLSEEQIQRLDSFGDAITRASIDARNAVAGGFADFLKFMDDVNSRVDESLARAREAQSLSNNRAGVGIGGGLAGAYAYGKTQTAKKAATANDFWSAAGFTPASPYAQSKGTMSEAKLTTAVKTVSVAATAATPKIKEMDSAVKEFNKSQEEAARAAERLSEQIQDRIGDAFESAVFDARNAGQAISGILNGIARQIARTAFINPLSEGIGNIIKDSGVGGWLSGLLSGKATGDYNVQNDEIVKVHKGEMIIPAPQAQMMRNGGSGGQIIVNQTVQVMPGVPELIDAKINESAPKIAGAAYDGVFAAMRKGGSASKIAGLRS